MNEEQPSAVQRALDARIPGTKMDVKGAILIALIIGTVLSVGYLVLLEVLAVECADCAWRMGR